MLNLKDLLESVVRGGVQIAVGVIASKGIIPAAAVATTVDSVTGLVVGGAVFLATVAWSLISKKKAYETPVK